MKIVLSVTGFFPHAFGGGQVYVHHVGKELQHRGHIVTILTTAPWQGDNGNMPLSSYEYKYDGLPVIAFSQNPAFISEGCKYSEMSQILMQGVRRTLIISAPDLVHINGLKAALITICDELKIPSVVTAHHPGFVCPAGTLLTPEELLCQKVASPCICIPCCSKIKVKREPLGTILGHIPSWIYRPVGRTLNHVKRLPYLGRGLMFPWLIEQKLENCSVLMKESQGIIAPSRAMKELLIRNNAVPEKVFHIPHGIKPMKRFPVDNADGRKIRFGYVGRIDRAKGFHILAEALEILSDAGEKAELHIFGGAQNPWDKEYQIQVLASYRGTIQIIDHGYIENDRLSEIYRSIDVLVFPSICFEVFGLVILEAFSAGRPVIVTKSGGPEEIVEDGIDGFIVDRNCSKSLARAIQRFIDDPALIVKMAKHIPHVRTIQEHVDDVESMYYQLIREMIHV